VGEGGGEANPGQQTSTNVKGPEQGRKKESMLFAMLGGTLIISLGKRISNRL